MSCGRYHHMSELLPILTGPLFMRSEEQLQEACSVMLMAAASQR
ncbi:hypothetical protein LINGRAHAP2_LOCUS8925 [Linum grandiflorum]